MQEQRIRIGTRGSRLAQIQTDMVIEQLKKHYPDVQFENIHFADSLLTLSYRIANR